ncbi:ImmA/IrrE family metallo-endopeptidase [Desulfosoma sp.]
MADLSLTVREWLTAGSDSPELAETTGWLEIRTGDTCLTRHVDIWSRTVRDAVLVSAYPLACWFAWYWWRLNYEPLPGKTPPFSWSMAHELGAAGHGYVWPRVLFASDGEAVQVWAESLAMPNQSVQYLLGLQEPRNVPLAAFQSAVDEFVRAVLDRLAAVGFSNTDLSALWARVKTERLEPQTKHRRQLEARLGFDPDECPQQLLAALFELQAETGDAALAELAPVYGQQSDAVGEIVKLRQAEGIRLAPKIEPFEPDDSSIPWQQGVTVARRLRSWIGNEREPIGDEELVQLLGLSRQSRFDEVTDKRRPVSVIRAIADKELVFLPRKHYPTARRFELARVLGDWLTVPQTGREWRVISDVSTVRQKLQRAFAAEFLCPIGLLTQFLGGDFSDTAIEEASEHFRVSEWTVRSLLANNGYLPRFEPAVPYRLAA